MRILGVCFGVGDGWQEAARWAAARMERVTGFECVTIGAPPPGFTGAVRHPSWWKCKVFDFVPADVDAVMIFDADVIAIGAATLEGSSLAADIHEAAELATIWGALDADNRGVRSECACYQLDMENYVNCGFLVVRREGGREILERAWGRGPNYGAWMEQTAINKEREAEGVTAHWSRGWMRFLPASRGPYDWREVNRPPAALVHVTGLGSQLKVLKDLQAQVGELHL